MEAASWWREKRLDKSIKYACCQTGSQTRPGARLQDDRSPAPPRQQTSQIHGPASAQWLIDDDVSALLTLFIDNGSTFGTLCRHVPYLFAHVFYSINQSPGRPRWCCWSVNHSVADTPSVPLTEPCRSLQPLGYTDHTMGSLLQSSKTRKLKKSRCMLKLEHILPMPIWYQT